MDQTTTGHYPIERREGEIERLHIQSAAIAADCEIMLERIGVGEGWACLDLGCGPGGITALLCARVGKSLVVVFRVGCDLLENLFDLCTHSKYNYLQFPIVPAFRCRRLPPGCAHSKMGVNSLFVLEPTPQ